MNVNRRLLAVICGRGGGKRKNKAQGSAGRRGGRKMTNETDLFDQM